MELYLYSLTCATCNRTLLIQNNRFSINQKLVDYTQDYQCLSSFVHPNFINMCSVHMCIYVHVCVGKTCAFVCKVEGRCLRPGQIYFDLKASPNAYWVFEKALVDLGVCQAHTTPYGTQFFHFHIHFHQKVPTLEVPPNRCMTPLQEILDLPLEGVVF